MTRSAPELDPARCVRAALRGAGCADCALACPAGALMPSLNGVDLDPALCTGCGQCQGACPASALGAPLVPPAEGAVLVLACSQSGAHVSVGCAHAPGLEMLAAWWLSGVRILAVATAECAACPDAPQVLLSARVAQLNALLEARGLDAMHIRRARRDERRRSEAPVDAGRRRLMPGVSTTEKGALAQILNIGAGPMAHSPVIDAARCSGCNACIRICPDAVLSLVKDASGAHFYTADASLCTGCALCEDVCDDDAISVLSAAPPPDPVALRSFACRVCGVQSYEPKDRDSDLCRICRARPHASNLHQVLS